MNSKVMLDGEEEVIMREVIAQNRDEDFFIIETGPKGRESLAIFLSEDFLRRFVINDGIKVNGLALYPSWGKQSLSTAEDGGGISFSTKNYGETIPGFRVSTRFAGLTNVLQEIIRAVEFKRNRNIRVLDSRTILESYKGVT
jgi:hypothetical protein